MVSCHKKSYVKDKTNFKIPKWCGAIVFGRICGW